MHSQNLSFLLKRRDAKDQQTGREPDGSQSVDGKAKEEIPDFGKSPLPQ